MFRESVLVAVSLTLAVLAGQTTAYCNPNGEWTSIGLNGYIGQINFNTMSPQSFSIPSIVPHTAQEILVYINIVTSNSQAGYSQIRVYTESSPERRFEKFLAVYTSPQHGHSMVEDNMWFPLTENRKLFIDLNGPVGDIKIDNVFVIGYR